MSGGAESVKRGFTWGFSMELARRGRIFGH